MPKYAALFKLLHTTLDNISSATLPPRTTFISEELLPK